MKIKSLSIIFLVVGLVFLTFFPAVGEEVNPAETVVAEVNGEPIYLEELQEIWDSIPDNYRSQFPGGMKDLLEQMVQQTLLVQEAKNQGIEDDPEVKKKIENLKDQILIQELIMREIVDKVEVTEEEVEKEYTSNPNLYTEAEQVKARHIMVSTKEKADQVLEQLSSGQPFEQVAQEQSESPDAQTGGDMGYVKKGDLAPEFEKVIFDLAPGNFSDAIETDYGYHIFLVEEHLQPRLKELSEVEEDIKARLLPRKQQETLEQLIQDLKNQAEIVIFEDRLTQTESPAEEEVAPPAEETEVEE